MHVCAHANKQDLISGGGGGGLINTSAKLDVMCTSVLASRGECFPYEFKSSTAMPVAAMMCDMLSGAIRSAIYQVFKHLANTSHNVWKSS
jgi:hypothetical protein